MSNTYIRDGFNLGGLLTKWLMYLWDKLTDCSLSPIDFFGWGKIKFFKFSFKDTKTNTVFPKSKEKEVMYSLCSAYSFSDSCNHYILILCMLAYCGCNTANYWCLSRIFIGESWKSSYLLFDIVCLLYWQIYGELSRYYSRRCSNSVKQITTPTNFSTSSNKIVSCYPAKLIKGSPPLTVF